jgi:hypothetical protein
LNYFLLFCSDFCKRSNGGDQGFNKIDLWIGGLAEKHVSGGILGTTFNTIFADQMERLQNGDRLYYLFRIDSEFQEARGLLTQIESEDFKDLVERNTGARHLQGDIFEYADNHLEFSEIAVSDPKSEHKYGGLAAVAQKHLGVFSTSGGSIGRNGTIVTVNGEQYVLDVRPDLGRTSSGKPRTGFNSDEVIGGTENNDYIRAGGGSNTVYGEGGNDIISGGIRAEFLYGGTGNDTIKGGNGADFINGSAGNDFLSGNNGADQLIGGDGNDIISGGNDDDDIFAGSGNDKINAGTGSNKILGGDGYDLVYKSGFDFNYSISFSDLDQWKIRSLNGSGDTDTLIEIERIEFLGGGAYNILNGTYGNDKIQASFWSLMNGGEGNDTLMGSTDNDIIFGGADNDKLFGKYGHDTLIDSKGNDFMFGGLGSDIFVFSKNNSLQAPTIKSIPVLDASGQPTGSFRDRKVNNIDFIGDFDVIEDTIKFDFGINPATTQVNFESLKAGGKVFWQSGADTYIDGKNLRQSLGEPNSVDYKADIVLQNVNLNHLSESNFIFS